MMDIETARALDTMNAQFEQVHARIDQQGTELAAKIDAQGTALRTEMAALGTDLRTEMAALGAGLRTETAALGTDLRAEAAASAATLRHEMRDMRTELIDRIDENRRHTDMMFENVRDDIRLLAEGIAHLSAKIDARF